MNLEKEKSIQILEKEIDQYILILEKEISSMKEGVIKEAIEDFEAIWKVESSKAVSLRIYFYNKIRLLSEKTQSLHFVLSISDFLTKKIDSILQEKYPKKNPYFMLLMDTYILTALYAYRVESYEISQTYFIKAVECGEKYLKESKKTYHDALNCAYTWVGYYLYNKGEYKEALPYFERVLELYEEVKDDPNYFVKEVDSVPNSVLYIEAIHSFL